ncbi:MAG: phage integrase N-terminal SAM-like domain-containing protein [Candidatus Thiodiazotropha sp. (ex. Lucinisca nassula)]|nr:phage integrase N-terminal SAM-like domain-containing protein [Candidatus Thiodiazotropha sp. (ex. Lucinisca nassula)]
MNNIPGNRFPGLSREPFDLFCFPGKLVNSERDYFGWFNRFLYLHKEKHPCDCSESNVASFLEQLVMKGKLSWKTSPQNYIFLWHCLRRRRVHSVTSAGA